MIVEGRRAAGVILDNGETIRAKYVVSGVNPKLLYTRLVAGGRAGAEFLARMSRWRNGSGTFRMNVALNAPALLHRSARRRRPSHRRHHPRA